MNTEMFDKLPPVYWTDQEIWNKLRLMPARELRNNDDLHIYVRILEFKRRFDRNDKEYNRKEGQILYGMYVSDGIDRDRPLPEGIAFKRPGWASTNGGSKTKAGTFNEVHEQYLPGKGGGKGKYVAQHIYAQQRPLQLLHNRWLAETRKMDRSELKHNGYAENFIIRQGNLMGIIFPDDAIKWLTFNKNV